MLDNKSGVVGRAIVDRRRKTEIAVMLETRAIDREFNSRLTPSALYNYYISICTNPMWDLTNNKKIGKELGHTERAVKDNRAKLSKAGWIKFDVHSYKGVRYGTWYLGKEVVASRVNTGTATLDELLNMGVVLEEEYEFVKGSNEDDE